MHIPATDLVHLLHETSHAILSTHSAKMPGFPFGTAVPLVLDEAHHPILLISTLAEHTKNLQSDPRASLAVVEAGKNNVQDARRATLVGHFRAIEATPAFICRYLRYQPDAEQYLELDFAFFRMDIERIRYIGGIGKMGWFEGSSFDRSMQITAIDESALLARFSKELPSRCQILGLDGDGIDYLTDGLRHRLCFDQPMNRNALEAAWPDLLRRLN